MIKRKKIVASKKGKKEEIALMARVKKMNACVISDDSIQYSGDEDCN